jgi:drug/metabolite transporter (DMT)-like permease
MPNLLTLFYRNPYAVLPAASLLWAGNSIMGKLAIGEVTPMTLTCLRWFFVVAMLAPFLHRPAMEALPALKGRWLWLIAMAVLGYTIFNALLYVAAHHTSGVNLTMLQASIPVMVLAGTVLIYAASVSPLQGIGTVLTLIGVAIVASAGDVQRLLALQFNIGDLYVLIACLLYTFYTLGLRRRPAMAGLTLFYWFAIVAMLACIPLFAYEVAQEAFFWPSWKGWAIIAYVTICPSFLSQIFYMRGVELIGPGRAGLFINLIPVFGAIMAVAVLNEPFGRADATAAALVFGGIAVAEFGKQA